MDDTTNTKRKIAKRNNKRNNFPYVAFKDKLDTILNNILIPSYTPQSISSSHGTVNEFSVLSYNICRSNAIRNIPYINWEDRERWVERMINSFEADIVCLQEARCYDDNIPIHSFMARFTQYDFVVTRSNTDIQSTTNIIAWKRNKFVLGNSETKWFSDTPDVPSNSWGEVYGRAFGIVKLYPKTLEGTILSKPIRIVNVHIGLDDKVRKKSYELLRNMFIDEIPTVMCGDFNFYPDNQYDNHRQLFNNNWNNSIHDDVLYDVYSGLKISGSFTGFSCDSQCIDGTVWGMLDGFYTRNLNSSEVITSTNAFQKKNWVNGDFGNDELTSDHLPLFCFINIPKT